MAVFALLSAGGSPGVTTTALALSLSWPAQVIIAECDPSGGDTPGRCSGHLPAAAGLLPLALEAGAGAEVPADTLWRQLVELDEEHRRLLLAGISDPRQSAPSSRRCRGSRRPSRACGPTSWPTAGGWTRCPPCGPSLSAATLAVLVLQPTLRQVSRAIPRVEMLVNLMGPAGSCPAAGRRGRGVEPELGQALGVAGRRAPARRPEDSRRPVRWPRPPRRLQERPLIRSAAAVGRGAAAAAAAVGWPAARLRRPAGLHALRGRPAGPGGLPA